MGINTLNSRSDGQTVNESWFNEIISALKGDFVPRDTTGAATSAAGSLGSSTLQWLYGWIQKLRLVANGHYAELKAPSGLAADYSATLPSALPTSNLPLMIDNTGAMTTGQIQNTQIAGSAVGSSQLADNSVTGVKIADGNVTSIKIQDGAITQTKRAALPYSISSADSGGFTTTATDWVDVTNLSITLTTTGRPVVVRLNGGLVYAVSNDGYTRFLRGATQILYAPVQIYLNPLVYAGALSIVDFPAAGTYTYKFQVYTNGAGGSIQVQGCKLLAYEL